MKLFVKQKVLSVRQQFSVRDENGGEKYFVWARSPIVSGALFMTDAQGAEVAAFQVDWNDREPACTVSVGGEEIARVRKEFIKFGCSHYVADSLGWEIRSNSLLFADYEICCHGQTIGRISQEWPSWGDCYGLELGDPTHELAALAFVMLIDYERGMNTASG